MTTEATKRWRENNKERYAEWKKEYDKKWREENPDKIKAIRKRSRDKYREKQKAKDVLIQQLEEENKKLKEENEKLHDEFMLKLAEAFLLPPTSNQMAEYKQWNFYKWYDEIKNQMRKEIKEGK